MAYVAPDITAVLSPEGAVPESFYDIEVATTSTLMIGVNVNAQLGFWEQPLSPTATITDSTGAVVANANTPVIIGTTVAIVVSGSSLVANHGYTLTFTWQNGTSGSVQSARLALRCPF